MQSTPSKNKLNIKALLSFIIFVLIITKDILVAYNIIPVRSLMNRQISYFVVLPLWIVGMVLSVWVMSEFFLVRRNLKKTIANINFWLALPILLDTIYFFIGLVFLLFRL